MPRHVAHSKHGWDKAQPHTHTASVTLKRICQYPFPPQMLAVYSWIHWWQRWDGEGFSLRGGAGEDRGNWMDVVSLGNVRIDLCVVYICMCLSVFTYAFCFILVPV